MEAIGGGSEGQGETFLGRLVGELETAVTVACDRENDWPRQIAAGIYAGVDFAAAHPVLAEALVTVDGSGAESGIFYSASVRRMAQLIANGSPARSRLPGATDEALVAGIVGLVGDHVRIGRIEALMALRPDLVLLALLPYLGFDDARRWANEFADRDVGR